MLQKGVRPETLRWKSHIPHVGLPENSQPHGTLTGERPPKGLHHNTRAWPHSKASKLPGLEDTRQIISKIGRQHCLLTHRLRRAIPSPQTPQNTPLAAASPFRETRASSTQQNTGTSPCKPAAVTDTSPSPPTGGRTHKEEELQPSICRKDTPHAENQTK